MLSVDLVGAVKFNIQHSTFNTPETWWVQLNSTFNIPHSRDFVGTAKFNIQHSTFNTPYINTPTGFLLRMRRLQALSYKHDHQPRYILFPAFRHPLRYCFFCQYAW